MRSGSEFMPKTKGSAYVCEGLRLILPGVLARSAETS